MNTIADCNRYAALLWPNPGNLTNPWRVAVVFTVNPTSCTATAYATTDRGGPGNGSNTMAQSQSATVDTTWLANLNLNHDNFVGASQEAAANALATAMRATAVSAGLVT